jgi:hypothetical protein
MDPKSQQRKRRDDALPSLNAAISALDQLAKDTANMKPAKDAFASASVLLATTRVGFLPVHVCWLFPDGQVGLGYQRRGLRGSGTCLR